MVNVWTIVRIFVILVCVVAFWRNKRKEGATRFETTKEVLYNAVILLIFIIVLLFVLLILARVTGYADCVEWEKTEFGKYFC
jgi:small-conductance mechanosensitive channel